MLKHWRCVLSCSWQTCAVRNKHHGKPGPATRPVETNAWLPKVFFPFIGHGKFMGFTNAAKRRAARGGEEWDGMTEQERRRGGGQREMRIRGGQAEDWKWRCKGDREKWEWQRRDKMKKKRLKDCRWKEKNVRKEVERKLRHKMNREKTTWDETWEQK